MVVYLDRATCTTRRITANEAAELNEFNKNLNRNFQELDYNNDGLVELADFENRIQRQDYDSKLNQLFCTSHVMIRKVYCTLYRLVYVLHLFICTKTLSLFSKTITIMTYRYMFFYVFLVI